LEDRPLALKEPILKLLMSFVEKFNKTADADKTFLEPTNIFDIIFGKYIGHSQDIYPDAI
jgi:hypothetical protein